MACTGAALVRKMSRSYSMDVSNLMIATQFIIQDVYAEKITSILYQCNSISMDGVNAADAKV